MENTQALKNFVCRGFEKHTEVRSQPGTFDYIALRDFNWFSWKKMCRTLGIANYEKGIVEIKEMLYANLGGCSKLDDDAHNQQFNALVDHALNEYLNRYNYPEDFGNYF